MLFLHELEHVLVLVEQFTFSFISRNVSIKQMLLSCFILFPINCLQTEESSQKHLNSANEVVHLARCETQDLYNTDTSDI